MRPHLDPPLKGRRIRLRPAILLADGPEQVEVPMVLGKSKDSVEWRRGIKPWLRNKRLEYVVEKKMFR